MNHIPYKGSGETVGRLLGGHIDLMFAAYSGLRAGVETKKITLDGGEQRQALVDGAGRSLGRGIRAGSRPRGDPGHHGAGRHVAGRCSDKIASEIAAIVKEPEVIQQFADRGHRAGGRGQDEYQNCAEERGGAHGAGRQGGGADSRSRQSRLSASCVDLVQHHRAGTEVVRFHAR